MKKGRTHLKPKINTLTIALVIVIIALTLSHFSPSIDGFEGKDNLTETMESSSASDHSTKSGTLLSNEVENHWIKQLKKMSTYDSDKDENYLEIIEKFPFANETYVLSLENNPQIYTDFYQKIKVVENASDLLVLVNKNYQLPEDYAPKDLVLPNVNFASNPENNYLRQEAALALEEMFQAASNEGYKLLARSGYRSYQTQVSLYDRYVAANGQAEADTYSARPGHSEHQTGLAIDVTSESVGYQLDDDFQLSPEGNWVKEHAHEYGFIVRYEKGKENLTGFQYEPWHLRYVGKEVATQIKENNWLLEDYLLMNGMFYQEF